MVETEFDFDKLYELVSKNYKNKNEKCLICHFSIEKEEIKLSCNHQYHFKCFDLNMNKKCSYCDKKITKNKNIKINNNINCNSLIKTGKRKGEICGRTNCKYHII
jgi:hypothetical protein